MNLKPIVMLCAASSLAQSAVAAETVHANGVVEWTVSSQKEHRDPFNDVELDFVVTAPGGQKLRVPGFWAGGKTWRGRYSSATLGLHRFRTECSDKADAGLHGVEGGVTVTAYQGDNPFYLHGPVQVAADKRHFVHADGSPFFWLGDTWWMGLCHRLHFPDEFQKLAADRKAKGFNVIQIVAGLYPDMHPFDPRGANEAGYPWEKDYARIRPEYFDAADKRISYLVEQGFSPCVVGAWGYFLPWMGAEKMNKHWRYLIARWGALPVVWCAAGEANLPWYLAKGFPYDDREQVKGWTDVMRFIRATDPFHRALTIHPTGLGPLNARHATDDAALLDFDMLQTPHGQREAVAPTVRAAANSYNAKPVMPMLNGEASYEMLGDSIPAQWPRAMFWLCMLNGAAGHTYGANGIWQCNRKGEPHGPSPHHNGGNGNTYGVIAWDDAMNLKGSAQVGFGKKFLKTLDWQKLEPHPEWATWETREAEPVGLEGAQWIWFSEGNPTVDAPVAKRYFRRTFEVLADKKITNARLRISCDDRFAAWLNGEPLGESADWSVGREFADVKLRAGQNTLAIKAENRPAPVTKNPAGLIGRLEIVFADGTKQRLETDANWLAATEAKDGWQRADFDAQGWQQSKLLGAYGSAPWGKITPQKQQGEPYCAGFGDELRVIYLLEPHAIEVNNLKPNGRYTAEWSNPLDGVRGTPLNQSANAQGTVSATPPSGGHDWVLVVKLENR